MKLLKFSHIKKCIFYLNFELKDNTTDKQPTTTANLESTQR